MTKPRAIYDDLMPPLQVGQPARLLVSGVWVITTRVEQWIPYQPGPIIETRNTFYWPGETDESLPKATRNVEVRVPYQYQQEHKS
jgi:hypothetical protein